MDLLSAHRSRHPHFRHGGLTLRQEYRALRQKTPGTANDAHYSPFAQSQTPKFTQISAKAARTR